MESNYITFLQELKDHILQSRYRAARLVNRELLLLYYAVGKRLSEKIAAEKWGAKVVEQLSADLQKHLPGLRGFSATNLKNMRQFADVYSAFPFGPFLTVQMEGGNSQDYIIGQLSTGQLEEGIFDVFLSVSFTHHILLLNRCNDWDERWFYMQKLWKGSGR
ncbi:DUF1016 N-terminal domain-containing protein [Spirosoma litoris]